MKQVSYTKSFEICYPIGKLFSLFSPEGEKSWVPGWDYINLTGDAELSEDDIFLTRSHDHGQSDAIWIVKRYLPDSHVVEYYKIEPENKVGIVKIQCSEVDEEITRTQVTYRYVALSRTGEMFISQFTEADYEKFIHGWEKLLQNYLGSE